MPQLALRLEALYRSGRLRGDMAPFLNAIETCVEIGERLRANAIRAYVARSYIDQGRNRDAIKLLSQHYDEARATRYRRLISEYDSLARARLQEQRRLGDGAAIRAARDRRRCRQPESVHRAAGERVPPAVPARAGTRRHESALAYHEKYAAADKGYLDDVSARQIAYERAKHEAAANRLQIDALNKQNEVLQLQQALGKKAVETSRLYIALLILVAVFIALFAYRTKRSQLHFMKLSRVDGLTGIDNRPYFIAQAERALEASRKLEQEVCVILCDLDHFKSINDKYGHATGDHVLRQAVLACRTHLRASDLFGRFGGEEFCILLPGCSLADARQRCEQLRVAIATVATDAANASSTVSASFGVAATSSSGYELRQLLAHADAALYRAKFAGRNCVVLYDTMHAVGHEEAVRVRLQPDSGPLVLSADASYAAPSRSILMFFPAGSQCVPRRVPQATIRRLPACSRAASRACVSRRRWKRIPPPSPARLAALGAPEHPGRARHHAWLRDDRSLGDPLQQRRP